MNNMNGWTVPMTPSRVAGKVEFFRRYKFTLAVENTIWPGYMTEKLVDPMFADSIPIYVGDPQAQLSFDPRSYIDVARFCIDEGDARIRARGRQQPRCSI